MAKSVKVNQEACIGCGMCLSFAEAIFAFNDEGKADVVAPVSADDEAGVEEAATNCPAAAIEVE